MSKLSAAEKKFLKDKRVPLSLAFDGAGLSPTERREAMRALGCFVAFATTSSCRADASHTLRTSANHCFQCKPETFGHWSRRHNSGQIYIAYSKAQRLVKIGVSVNVHERMATLNKWRYGGASDWRCMRSETLELVGSVESDMHARLASYAVPGRYYMNGNVEREASELFKCDLGAALRSLDELLKWRA